MVPKVGITVLILASAAVAFGSKGVLTLAAATTAKPAKPKLHQALVPCCIPQKMMGMKEICYYNVLLRQQFHNHFPNFINVCMLPGVHVAMLTL